MMKKSFLKKINAKINAKKKKLFYLFNFCQQKCRAPPAPPGAARHSYNPDTYNNWLFVCLEYWGYLPFIQQLVNLIHRKNLWEFLCRFETMFLPSPWPDLGNVLQYLDVIIERSIHLYCAVIIHAMQGMVLLSVVGWHTNNYCLFFIRNIEDICHWFSR